MNEQMQMNNLISQSLYGGAPDGQPQPQPQPQPQQAENPLLSIPLGGILELAQMSLMQMQSQQQPQQPQQQYRG